MIGWKTLVSDLFLVDGDYVRVRSLYPTICQSVPIRCRKTEGEKISTTATPFQQAAAARPADREV